MASVVEVTTEKPRVSGATLKLSKGDLVDMKMFIEEWYYRHARSVDVKSNDTHKAVVNALAGVKEQPAADFFKRPFITF